MTTAPLSSSAVRLAYRAELCTTQSCGDRYPLVAFPGGDRVWELPVAAPTVTAWEAFAAVMVRHRYYFTDPAGGTFNPRPIAGTQTWSLHAYAVALDLNPSTNGPQGTSNTDQPEAFRDDLKALHTASGRQCFSWGGDWSPMFVDPMHWQIGATPSELATGIIDPNGDDMPLSDEDLTKIVDAVRPMVRHEVRWLTRNDTNPEGKQITQAGGAVLSRTALVGQKGSAAWVLKQVWEKVHNRDWSSIPLEPDGLGEADE